MCPLSIMSAPRPIASCSEYSIACFAAGVNGTCPADDGPPDGTTLSIACRSRSGVTPSSSSAAAPAPCSARETPSSRCPTVIRSCPRSAADSWASTTARRDPSVNRSNTAQSVVSVVSVARST